MSHDSTLVSAVESIAVGTVALGLVVHQLVVGALTVAEGDREIVVIQEEQKEEQPSEKTRITINYDDLMNENVPVQRSESLDSLLNMNSRLSSGDDVVRCGRQSRSTSRRATRRGREGRRRRSSSTDSVPGTIINLNFDTKHLLRVDGELTDEKLDECRDELFLSTYLRRTDTEMDYTGWASEKSRKKHSLIVLEGDDMAEKFAEDLHANYSQLGGDKHNRNMTTDGEYPMLQYKRVGPPSAESFKCVSLMQGRVVVGVDNRHNPRVDPFINHLDGKETMMYMKTKTTF